MCRKVLDSGQTGLSVPPPQLRNDFRTSSGGYTRCLVRGSVIHNHHSLYAWNTKSVKGGLAHRLLFVERRYEDRYFDPCGRWFRDQS
jgi:hypothetical protein